MDDEEFKSKYGALYDGLCLDMEEGEDNKRKSGLLFPFFFVLRRILFVVSAIWLDHFVWAQMAIQFECSTAMVIYLLSYWPFEEDLFTKLEVLNEITTVFLLYCMLCFTDWVPGADTRYTIGWVFILITCTNLLIHLSLLAKNGI